MAIGYTIQGPLKMQIGASAAALSDVGFSTNEDLFRVSVDRRSTVVQATDTGNEPAQIVHTGVLATITGTLSKWDQAVIDDFMTPPGSSVEGQAGVIGSAWVGGSNLFTVRLLPLGGSGKTYTADECMIDGGAFALQDFGNDNLKMAVTFTVLRQGQDGSSASAVIMDVS